MVKHISCDCKFKLVYITCNLNWKWNNNKYHCQCKKCSTCKKDYSWNPHACFCENSRHLKIILDDSVIACDEIINVAHIVSTNVTNTVSTNIMSTVSTNINKFP